VLSLSIEVTISHPIAVSSKQFTYVKIFLSVTKSYVTYSVDSIVGDEGIIMKMQLVKMVVMMKSENKG
jgi:hypothetical protein